MTPPEACHHYREQMGAFLLGKLDEGEWAAMQTHLNSCPVCQAEVRELEPVAAGLADADPDRIDEYPWPPGDLEELTLAPILGEIHRTRRGTRLFPWSAVAAAAICVVVLGLAGFTWLLEPAVALEPLSFSVAPGMDVEGHLIKHATGTEIGLVVFSGLQDGQTYRVTLVSKDEKRVNAGTFIGAGDRPVRGTFKAALLREDAARLEVRAPGGEQPVFSAKLPEEPRVVRDWPLLGILPWADPGHHNETMGPSGLGPSGPESPEGPTQKKPKAGGGSGSGTPPPNGRSPESGPKRSSPPSGGKPGAPEGSEPGGDQPPSGPPSPGPSSPGPSSPEPSSPEPDPCKGPPDEQPSACLQYEPRL